MRAGAALRARTPIADPAARARAIESLAEAIRRQREPGAWCKVGRGSLREHLVEDADAFEPEVLLEVAGWLAAARDTRAAWSAEPTAAERHPRLSELVSALPVLDALGERLSRSLDDDGRVRDEASPELRRLRAAVGDGERRLHQRLERWAAAFGASAYVTRFADRFVALVPAAGFARS